MASYGLGWCQANPVTALLGVGCAVCVVYFIGPSFLPSSGQNPQTTTQLSNDVTGLKEISLIHDKGLEHLNVKAETLYKMTTSQFDMQKALARKVETQRILSNDTSTFATEISAKVDGLAEEVVSLLDIHVGIDNRLTALTSVMVTTGTETAARVGVLEGEVASQGGLGVELNNRVETLTNFTETIGDQIDERVGVLAGEVVSQRGLHVELNKRVEILTNVTETRGDQIDARVGVLEGEVASQRRLYVELDNKVQIVTGTAELADVRSATASGMVTDVQANCRRTNLVVAEELDRHSQLLDSHSRLFDGVFQKLKSLEPASKK